MGIDLSVQLWNVSDGSNLMQIEPQLYSTTLAHYYANLPRSITTLNYELIDVGETKPPKKLFIIGTDHGNLCGYYESNSFVDPIPIFFLRLNDQEGIRNQSNILFAVDQKKKKINFNSLVKNLIEEGSVGSSTVNKPQNVNSEPSIISEEKNSNDNKIGELKFLFFSQFIF